MKFYNLFFIIFFFLLSCGKVKSGTDNVVADGNYQNYMEACHAQDFDAAHRILNKMKEKNSEDYSEAREYIFNQEVLFLIAQNDSLSTKRIFFLLQEDANQVDDETRDNRCNSIIDLAIKQNNPQLVNQTISQYSGIINKQTLKKIYNFSCVDGKESDLVDMIALLQKNDGVDILVEDAIKQGNDALLRKLISKNVCANSPLSYKAIAAYAKENNYPKMLKSVIVSLKNNKAWDTLMDLGIEYNDIALIKQSYHNTAEKDNAFEKLSALKSSEIRSSIFKFLLTICTNEDRAAKLIQYAMTNDEPDIVVTLTKKFGSKFENSLLDDVMNYAISKNGSTFTNLVVSILTSKPISGHPLPAGQRMTSNRPYSVVADHNEYVRSVSSFNAKCDEVLQVAISQHKGILARKVVSLYKKVPIEYVVNKHWWQIAKTCTYSDEDKKRAQEEVNEAKKRGDI